MMQRQEYASAVIKKL